MSVIVKGIFGKEMPMPQEGYVDIRLHFKGGRIECATMPTGEDPFYATFDVEKLPPHGRLIDKDKLRRDLFVNFDGQKIPFYDCDNFPTKISYRDLHSILTEQKTVIEAEGETDGR